MKKKYFIAVDIGQASIGLCLLDERFRPVKVRGKTAMPVRQFEEAHTAADRRVARGSRRRLKKRKFMRLNYLQEIFHPYVTAVDENFFRRLEESFLFLEDKTVKSANILFDDACFTDKEYYKRFPTIFHLRKFLCESDEKADIRLIYLALHNIMKKRGNFLSESLDMSRVSDDPAAMLVEIRNRLADAYEDDLADANEDNDLRLSAEQAQKAVKLLTNGKRAKTVLRAEAMKAERTSSPVVKEVYSFLLGLKARFPADPKLKDRAVSVAAGDDDFDDKCEKIAGEIDDGEFMPALKLLYDALQLQKMGLKPGMTVSDLQIERYNRHKAQLKQLKDAVHQLCPEKYDAFFHSYSKDEKANYAKYVMGRGLTDNKSLVDAVRKMLAPFSEYEQVQKIYEQLDGEEYLPMQRSSRNAVFGYGLSVAETERIIDKQAAFYPFLRERKDDIIKLLSFRVDYFVGPLYEKDEKNKFSYIVKNSGDRVTPFNYDEVIDIESTQENFITRMTGKCSYLQGEDVLPKNSLLYSEFAALNLINNIKVNGKKLDYDQRVSLTGALKKVNSMSVGALKKWWKNNFPGDEPEISGLADDAKLTMKPFKDFTEILGREPSGDEWAHAEEIARRLTIFSDKKTRRQVVAKEKEALSLSGEQIEKLAAINYTGWGKLSRKLLDELFIPVRGEPYTVMDIMRIKGKNFMQALSFEGDGGATIEQVVQAENASRQTEDDAVDRMFLSTPVKRAVRQAMRMIEEITAEVKGKIKGKIEAVVLEFAAEDGKKEKTQSRAARMEKLYKTAAKEGGEFFGGRALEELLTGDLSDDAKMLYFSQQGKCMYCSRPLNIGQLSQSAQVDHVIPRSLIKDDSLDNKVLVCTHCNQEKRVDPIGQSIRLSQQPFWAYLLKHGFISQKKFDRLNIEEFGERELRGFINRQLVETRQTIRAVADLISSRYKVPVIPVKMDAVKAFRDLAGYEKNDGWRLVNDFHHAYDAYIAGVVGAFGWLNRELNPIINPSTDAETKKEHLGRIVKAAKTAGRSDKAKYGFLINKMTRDYIDEDGRVVWQPSRDLATVKKVLNYKDITVSKLTYIERGEFFKATRLPGKKKAKLLKKKYDYDEFIPLKGDLDPEKYGGFSSVQPACGVLVEYTKKAGRTREIISVSRLLAERLGLNKDNAKEKLKKYFDENAGKKYKDLEVLKIVPKYQLVEMDGIRYRISGGYLHHAGQLRLPGRQLKTVTKLYAKRPDATDEEMTELLRVYVDRLRNYYPKYKIFADKVSAFVDCGNFAALSFEKKKKFIGKCLEVTKCGSAQINFTEFPLPNGKFGVSEGEMKLSIKDIDFMTFIDQSVTGLIENKTVLALKKGVQKPPTVSEQLSFLDDTPKSEAAATVDQSDGEEQP